MGVSIVMEIPKNGLSISMGKSQSKMDDEWGYPYDETETSKYVFNTIFFSAGIH